MLSRLKSIGRRVLAHTPFRITRSPPNRFDAIEHCLHRLARSSFSPSIVIDAGAHQGGFAKLAHDAFPFAAIHMIEPQPVCAPILQKLSEKPGHYFYPVAVTSQVGRVRMVVNEAHRIPGDTGAHIAWPENEHQANLDVPGTTLDELFLSRCGTSDRILLKLDLQGHEMLALRGASRLLPHVDVVLLEISFFQQVGEPTVPALIQFFDTSGFDLFDIAALSGRTRDDRLRQGDAVFVRRETALWRDKAWE